MNEMLLLEYNHGRCHTRWYFDRGCIVYRSCEKSFNGYTIKDILSFVDEVHKTYKNVNVPISFEFEDIEFEDKLTYIFFEVICYILIRYYRHNVFVKFRTQAGIFTEGIDSSPLLLLKTGEKRHLRKFIDKYSFDIFNSHYRRLFSPMEMKDDKLSKIMDGIGTFLKGADVGAEYLDDITEVIIELIGNVAEHSSSECLIDIDITSPYRKRDQEGTFYGINLTVLNFSKFLFHERIKNRILYSEEPLEGRYQKVKEAYEFHEKSFNENYWEQDFFNIAAFQHKISGNSLKHITGGTGLTKLICSLETRSDTHFCYLISGERALWFDHKLLEYNGDNWIGFNQEKDFIAHLPENGIVTSSRIYMPGTAYNLNFVMKGD